MCLFITMVVGGGDTALITKTLKSHGRNAYVCDNPSLKSVQMADERQYVTTAGECDCGTALVTYEIKPRKPVEAEIPKLRSKGWSEAKIRRWYDEKQTAQARNPPEDPSKERAFWENLTEDVLALPGVKSAGLFVHFYSGALDDEVFAPTRLQVKWNQFGEHLREGERDRLLIVRK